MPCVGFGEPFGFTSVFGGLSDIENSDNILALVIGREKGVNAKLWKAGRIKGSEEGKQVKWNNVVKR